MRSSRPAWADARARGRLRTWPQKTSLMKKNIDRAKTIGAVAAYAVDAREEFTEGYVWPSLKANALYQGTYPLSTAIARPLIAKILVDVARKEGADFIAHGCTAKGNDQVRFDVSIGALAPEIGIIAPMKSSDAGLGSQLRTVKYGAGVTTRR